MLKGREVSEIRFKNVDLKDRADAEFFSKENLLINERLNHTQTIELGELGKIAVSAFYPAATHLYEIGEVPFIRCVDCINFPVISDSQNDSFERIPQDFLDRHSNIDTVRRNELIITKVGSPCYASIVGKDEELALSRTVMGLKDIRGINPFYLLAFLRSYYGFSQLLRQRELTIQYQLTVERVKTVKVFLPSVEFQRQIESIVKQSHQSLEESRVIYKQAENLLLEAVGLKDFEVSRKNTNAVSVKESLFLSGRLDAEFYQPKYEEYQRFFAAKTGGKTLGDLATLRKGYQSRSLSETGTLYASIKDANGFLVETTERTNQSDLVTIEQKEIVLAITGATIGKTGISATNEPIAISGDLVGIKPHTISPYYLQVVLSSKPIQEMCRQYTTGATNGHLTVSDVASFPIPLIDETTQEIISQNVISAIEQRNESKNLLETAKRAVEIAIEETEEKAIEFIKTLTV